MASAVIVLTGCFGEVDPAQYAAEEGPSLADKTGAEHMLLLLQQPASCVMSYEPSSNTDAYIEDVSTGLVTRLSNSSGGESAPMLSPDRRYLLFTSTDLVVMNLRDGGIDRLTRGFWCQQPRWKSDASEILFVGKEKGPTISGNTPVTAPSSTNDELYIVDRRGGRPINLTNTPDLDEFDPDWLNDDSAVVFIAKRPDESRIVQVVSLPSLGRITVPMSLTDSRRIQAVAWSNVPRTVTVLLDGTPCEFLDVNIDSGNVEVLGTINTLHGVSFDRCESTGRFALATLYTVSADETGFRPGIPPPVMLPTDAAVWSHDSRFITYGREGFPIGFLENLKQGRMIALKDRMATIDKNGDVQFSWDDFYEYYPVVQEVTDPVTGVVMLKNLSRKEALRLLEPKGAWLFHHWNLEELPWKLKADEEMHAIMSK
jgi:hypothetical protein